MCSHLYLSTSNDNTQLQQSRHMPCNPDLLAEIWHKSDKGTKFHLQQACQENAQDTDFTLLLEAKSKNGANGYGENVKVRNSTD